MSMQRESQSNRRRLIRLSISAAANGLSRNRLATDRCHNHDDAHADGARFGARYSRRA